MSASLRETGSRPSGHAASGVDGGSRFNPARQCDQCGGAREIRLVVSGERLCVECVNKWLIEETDSFALADRLRPDEREIVLALSGKPSRIGARTRVPIVDGCEFALFDKVWGGDSFRHFLTPFGVEVKDALIRLEGGKQ